MCYTTFLFSIFSTTNIQIFPPIFLGGGHYVIYVFGGEMYGKLKNIRFRKPPLISKKKFLDLSILVYSSIDSSTLVYIRLHLSTPIWWLVCVFRTDSKKQRLKKYCSRDKACQLSALWGIFWWIYLEKLIIGDKYINKRVQLYTHQTMCVVSKMSG